MPLSDMSQAWASSLIRMRPQRDSDRCRSTWYSLAVMRWPRSRSWLSERGSTSISRPRARITASSSAVSGRTRSGGVADMASILRPGRRAFCLTQQPTKRRTGACILILALHNAVVQNQTTSDSWQQLLEMPRKSWWARLPFGVRMAAGASAVLAVVGAGAAGIATLTGGEGGGQRIVTEAGQAAPALRRASHPE